jgi:Ca-activated chloride channel family protein
MSEDEFEALKKLNVPLPDAAARRRAIGASLLAFDQAATASTKKTAAPLQGFSLWRRLTSIVPRLKGSWIMDTRRFVPAGTAVLAMLIILPLGYQLYSSTALTRPTLDLAPARPPVGVPPPVAGKDGVATDQLAAAPVSPAPAPEPVVSGPANGGLSSAATSNTIADKPKLTAAPAVEAVGGLAKTEPASAPATALRDAAAMPSQVANEPQDASVADGDVADLAVAPAAAAGSGGAGTVARAIAPQEAAPLPELASKAVAPVAIAPQPTGDKFATFTESPQKAVATDPVSTFSIDVDTASYSYVRRALNEGRIPEPDAVRLEEMINYFPYDYPAATSASEPFRPTVSVFPTPWNSHTELMQIGIKGFVPPASARKPSNLVFLVDTSGSMDEPDKLPLLQRALGLLVNTLTANDTVSIVAYAGSAGVVLEPTSASDKTKILSALDNLSAGGSTAGAEGIELAYQLASQHKTDGNNRVILATDGDFNVGISDPEQLKQFIKAKRQSGIGLSVLGFGEGNLDDATMQALAQNGDGNASYIDTLSEAQKVLVKEAGSTLDTIAKDVKIQIEFNPATVAAYRLIGYETRALAREDFNNDKVDAGDVGAGHTVTALYEITPVGAGVVPPVDALRYGVASSTASAAGGASTELADLKLRYKVPGSEVSQLIEQPVTPAMVVSDIAAASNDARWAAAVAAFGQKLKGSDYAGGMSYAAIQSLAAGARGVDPDGYRSEFVRLVGLAGALSSERGQGAPPAAE